MATLDAGELLCCVLTALAPMVGTGAAFGASMPTIGMISVLTTALTGVIDSAVPLPLTTPKFALPVVPRKLHPYMMKFDPPPERCTEICRAVEGPSDRAQNTSRL